MNRKLLFVIINILLVGIVGLICGLTMPIGSSNTLLVSFILLLVTLCVPSALFLTLKDATGGVGITSIIFGVGNLVALIVFMSMHASIDVKVVAITEGAFVGAFLIIMLICIAAAPKKSE